MSTFTPTDLEVYKRTLPPPNEAARQEYLDQQLRSIERSIQHLVTAVQQLQEEIDLVWSVAGPRP